MFGNDITKCEGINCEKRDTCCRFLAKPDRLQSYSAFYDTIKDGKCEYYWRFDHGSTRDCTRITEIV